MITAKKKSRERVRVARWMATPTKRERARAARGMAMATRVAGDEKGNGNGNKEGNGNWQPMATTWAMATAKMMVVMGHGF
jgi:hypothetical protein